MIELIYWSTIVFILYTYVGYPLLLKICRRKEVLSQCLQIQPYVSIVIAVCNEAGRIGSRLDNLLSQEYPREKMQIIVVSDGSSDGTVEAASRYQRENVRIIELDDWQGKAVAVNLGVKDAIGELIVFADARQTFAPNAISRLVANFADPSVGCVSGELLLCDDGDSSIKSEMGAYWRYEKWIRRIESSIGSVVGATGSIYAIRRELYRPLPSGTLLDDVLTPLNIAQQGYRVLFDSSARAYDNFSIAMKQEWQRKVRTMAGNWQLLSLNRSLFVPWRNPIWPQFMSHKICRLVVPYALLLLFTSNLYLQNGFYLFTLCLQSILYLLSSIGYCFPSWRKLKPVNISCFFVAMNCAAVAGFWKWFSGGCATVWQPASDRRQGPQPV